MPQLRSLLLVAALVAAGCSGGADDEAAPTSSPPTTSAPTTSTEATTTTSEPETTSTSTTVAPTTTIDEEALLAAAEAAYLEAFKVGKEVLRDPENPTNEERLRDHFVGPNLDGALEDLRRATEGGFVAVESPSTPSFATVVTGAEFVEGDTDVARLTVCEYNSDRIFEVGTAPEGGDTLRRDDPVTILITVRMEQDEDGIWRTRSGTRGEEVRDEEPRCSDA